MNNPLKTYRGKLGIHRATHLLRRTTYALKIDLIQDFADKTAQEAIAHLLDVSDFTIPEPIDHKNGQPFINVHRGKPKKLFRAGGSKIGKQKKYILGWWINEAKNDTSIRSKLSFFLHTCFAIQYNTENVQPHHLFDYLQLLSKYATGNYKKLALEMVVDNAMLEFLDNYTNSKDNPNENFAREFFELFTIGKGAHKAAEDYTTYTEEDVRTAARLLTGFVKGPKNLNGANLVSNDILMDKPNRGEAAIEYHDNTNKIFSNAFQHTKIKGAVTEEEMWRELSDFVTMIFRQQATAQNICRKMYRFFVHHEINDFVETKIITPLANILLKNDYELKPVLEKLLRSQHFLGSSKNPETIQFIGGICKSPLELSLQTLSFFEVAVPDPEKEPKAHYVYWFRRGLLENIYTASMGFQPFQPQDVAGYPPYYQAPSYSKGWINSSSIVGRYQMIKTLLKKKNDPEDMGMVQLNIVSFIKNNIPKPSDATTVVKTLTKYLLPLPLPQDRFDYFLHSVFLDGYTKKVWQSEWKIFEKTGNTDNITPPLERLITGIINAPEYQVM